MQGAFKGLRDCPTTGCGAALLTALGQLCVRLVIRLVSRCKLHAQHVDLSVCAQVLKQSFYNRQNCAVATSKL